MPVVPAFGPPASFALLCIAVFLCPLVGLIFSLLGMRNKNDDAAPVPEERCLCRLNRWELKVVKLVGIVGGRFLACNF